MRSSDISKKIIEFLKKFLVGFFYIMLYLNII